MSKFTWLTVSTVLLILLLTPPPGLAQEPVKKSWEATYWNNQDLAGSPVLEQRVANVDYNWGTDAPAPEVDPNNFSARWERTIEVEPGVYRFTATSDDGLRVWLDDTLIIDDLSLGDTAVP